jgi:hypothetical protein
MARRGLLYEPVPGVSRFSPLPVRMLTARSHRSALGYMLRRGLIALDPETGTGAGGGTGTGDGNGTGGSGQGNSNPDPTAAINAAVAAERARFEAQLTEVRGQLTTTTAELEKFRKATPPGDGQGDAATRAAIEAARKPLEEDNARLTRELAEIRTGLLRADLKGAVAESAVDADEVADKLAAFVKRTADGKLEVLDDKGNPRYGKSGPMTLAERVAELYASKPYLAKAASRPGAGFEGGKPNAGASELDAQIEEAERKGEWAKADRLKAEKLRALRS